MSAHEKNVAVIHCKAGKGRTGLMICSYMLYSKEWNTPKDALDFYAAMRTYNKKVNRNFSETSLKILSHFNAAEYSPPKMQRIFCEISLKFKKFVPWALPLIIICLKGVTIPSQIRYVHYMGAVMNTFNGKAPEPRTLLLKSITFHALPNVSHVSDIKFSAYVFKTLIYSFKVTLRKK